MLWNPLFQALLREIAVNNLGRVELASNRGLYGVVIDRKDETDLFLVHWGVIQMGGSGGGGVPVQTWTREQDLIFVKGTDEFESCTLQERTL